MPFSEGECRWIDIIGPADPDTLLQLLGQTCEGLELDMLADLLCPDEIPENRRWHGGDVRLASSFAVHSPEAWPERESKTTFGPSADAVYEPVELLAGESWLITRWHDACHYRGANLVKHGLPPILRDDVLAAVSRRWARCSDGNAGDLGVFVMNELSLTYASVPRRLYGDLEEWELRLYESDGEIADISEQEEARLHDLWGARARLRDWLNPLNVPGLRSDPSKAWLPATDHETVVAIDKRVDRALLELSDLGETLRSSFHLLHIKKVESQRERNERLQRDLGFLATGFVVPTLVVGFYGANTWVPGEHQEWGFLEMIIVIVVATTAVLFLLRKMLRPDEAETSG
jgi:hypothetical protein